MLDIRPSLELDLAPKAIEQFQNTTLRPILKFQNPLILAICQHQFIKRKSLFFKLGTTAQLDYIEQQIRQDTAFRQLLLGAVIGHFTSEEWTFFKTHENELKKRMINLLIQRVQSQSASISID